MRTRPEDLDEGPLLGALGEWRIAATSLEYALVGFGDHHWIAAGDDGGKWFLTIADLALKDEADPEAALRGAMDTAAALADEGHVDFVVAPLRAAGGETVRRLGPRYALSVFPFVTGVSGESGPWTARDRGAVLDLLAELHRQAPPASAPVLDLGLAARGLLESALDGAVRWERGPFAEPAEKLIAAHSALIRRRLTEFDRLAEEVRAGAGAPVLTHGEPHPGNLLRHEGRYLLVDWDTVGLAPPERDLWSVAESPADLTRYAEATGRTADTSALELYRLRWDFDEVSSYVDWFRGPHERSADTEQGWQDLRESVGRLGVD